MDGGEEFEAAGITSPADVARGLGRSLSGLACALVDGSMWDLHRPLEPGARAVNLLPLRDGGEVVQGLVAHSAAHVMGAALEAVVPGVLLAAG